MYSCTDCPAYITMVTIQLNTNHSLFASIARDLWRGEAMWQMMGNCNTSVHMKIIPDFFQNGESINTLSLNCG